MGSLLGDAERASDLFSRRDIFYSSRIKCCDYTDFIEQGNYYHGSLQLRNLQLGPGYFRSPKTPVFNPRRELLYHGILVLGGASRCVSCTPHRRFNIVWILGGGGPPRGAMEGFCFY